MNVLSYCPRGRLAAVALAAALAGGCGGGVGTVTGTVKYQGKPLASGSVVFAADGHPPVTAAIDENGTYTAREVPAGPAAVAVSSPDPRVIAARASGKGGGEMTAEDLKERQQKGLGAGQRPPTPDPKKWFPIPEQLADPRRSGLTTTIRNGENTFNIDLP